MTWPKHPEKYRQIMCYALDGLWTAIDNWMEIRKLDDVGLLDEKTSDELLRFCEYMTDKTSKTQWKK